jgi:lysophospholipase L1-like esterase
MRRYIPNFIFAVILGLILLFGILCVPHAVLASSPILKVMPLGDSITLGTGDGSAKVSDYDGYRCALKNALLRAGQQIDYVGSLTNGPTQCTGHDIQHEGHGGWTSTQLLGQVGGWVTTAQPDVVLLMIGTNDIKLRQWAGLNDRLGSIIDAIHTAKPGTLVIVSTIVQYNYNLDQPTIDAWNAYLAAVPIVAANHNAALAYNNNITKRVLVDGIHPSGCAYDHWMAYNWYAAMTQALPAPNEAGWVPQYPDKNC